jgi:glycosyltransferase involved in cell wall biosynthesis
VRSAPAVRHVSVVIPARNEAGRIREVVAAVRAQARPELDVEVLVVDDGSMDATPADAAAAGARVIRVGGPGIKGNPAAARNRGALESTGDPVVFLDADCIPDRGWIDALLSAHDQGAAIVGGSLDLPEGLSSTARADYYSGWYLVHSGRPAGPVPHHPPPNLSVRRDVFLATSRFTEASPFEYTNEERRWEGEARRAGHVIWFEPAARAWHHNRPGFRNLLARNYRWAYTALEAKGQGGSARFAWIYRYPRLLIALSLPLAIVHTAYVLGCWLRAGVFGPLLVLPAVVASRIAYAAGMAAGGLDWLRRRRQAAPSGSRRSP